MNIKEFRAAFRKVRRRDQGVVATARQHGFMLKIQLEQENPREHIIGFLKIYYFICLIYWKQRATGFSLVLIGKEMKRMAEILLDSNLVEPKQFRIEDGFIRPRQKRVNEEILILSLWEADDSSVETAKEELRHGKDVCIVGPVALVRRLNRERAGTKKSVHGYSAFEMADGNIGAFSYQIAV